MINSKPQFALHPLVQTVVFLLSMQFANAKLLNSGNSENFNNSFTVFLSKFNAAQILESANLSNGLASAQEASNGLKLLWRKSMNNKVNKSRRNILLSTGVVGAVGAGFVAVPFLKSWLPSERAKALGGPVKANFSKLETGQMISVVWRGQPVFIVNRTERQTQVLASLNKRLKDPSSETSIQPDYIDGIYRAKKENLLVVIGICTHLGCVPKYYPGIAPQQFDNEWKGGFFCPCHNSRFDISGRVFNGSPASRNLDIPPHMYLDDYTIEIGNDEEQA